MKKDAFWWCCCAGFFVLMQVGFSAVGPYEVVTSRGVLTLTLDRIEEGLLWGDLESGVLKEAETGIPLDEIMDVRIPRPDVLEELDALSSPEKTKALEEAFRRWTYQHEPFRSLPGVPYDEMAYGEARLLQQQGQHRRALMGFKDVLSQGTNQTMKTWCMLYAGFSLYELGRHDEALSALSPERVLNNDPELLSRVHLGLGDIYTAKGDFDQALMHYLQLVVFYPFVDGNTLKGYGNAAVCYAYLNEKDALQETVTLLEQRYPDAQETRDARSLLRKLENGIYLTPENLP